MNSKTKIKNVNLITHEIYTYIWVTRKNQNLYLITKRMLLILLVALTPIWCSKEENVPETTTIYLWDFYEWGQLNGLEKKEKIIYKHKSRRLVDTLLKPFHVFFSSYRLLNNLELKINKWVEKNINNITHDKIMIKDDIDFLNMIYVNEMETYGFNEKIYRFIQKYIINTIAELDDIKRYMNLFFKAVNFNDASKYLNFANYLMFRNIIEKLYILGRNVFGEIKIEVIFNNNITDILEGNGIAAKDQNKHNINRIMDVPTIIKIDMYYLIKNLMIYYNNRIDCFFESNDKSAFIEMTKKWIQGRYSCFKAEYEKVLERSIERNENIYIFVITCFSTIQKYVEKVTEMQTDKNIYSSRIRIFLKDTLPGLKDFESHCSQMSNYKTRLERLIELIDLNLDISIKVLNDNNFKIFVENYKKITMKDFLDIENKEIENDLFYMDFMKKKTMFLDEILDQIVPVFIKKQIKIILQNQNESVSKISKLIKQEKNRISEKAFIKTALERGRAFQIINEEEIEKFKNNIKINPNLYRKALLKLESLKLELPIIDSLINLRIREIFFSVDIKRIESYINEKLQDLCQGLNTYFKSLSKQDLLIFQKYICNKDTLIPIYKLIMQNITVSNYKVNFLDFSKFEKEITLLQNIPMEKINIDNYENRFIIIIKQYNSFPLIIEHLSKHTNLIINMRRNDYFYNKSIRNVIKILTLKLKRSKEDLEDITINHNFFQLETRISIIKDLNTIYYECDKLMYLLKSRIMCIIRNIVIPKEEVIEKTNLDDSSTHLFKRSNIVNIKPFDTKIPLKSEFDMSKELDVFFGNANLENRTISFKQVAIQISEITFFYDEFIQIFSNIFKTKNYIVLEKNINKIDQTKRGILEQNIIMKKLLSEFETNNIFHTLHSKDVEQKFVGYKNDILSALSFLVITPLLEVINDINTLFSIKVSNEKLLGHLVKVIELNLKNKSVVFDDKKIVMTENINNIHLENKKLFRFFVNEDKQLLEEVLSLINKTFISEPIFKWLNIVDDIDKLIHIIPNIIKYGGKGYVKIFKMAVLALEKLRFDFTFKKDCLIIIFEMNNNLEKLNKNS